MLQGLALIFLGGMALGRLSSRLRLPPLLGMLLAGILLGPHVLGLLDERILLLSSDLRRIALLIILTRAGLNLRLEDLRRVGRPALLMCFLPACFELVGMVLLAPKLLGVRPVLDAAKAVAMTAEWYKLFYAKHPQMRAFSIKQIENFCSAARDKQIEWSF